ncbi:MAG TPA: hypothetical protein PLF00_09705 [Candidatus Marinimicrobia bacterium]|jgi:hypothetical protein|nr:hypothetical protein [Candidatus Neomarinimicrobiota bacterium]HPY00300.1 hypothetical protein [Candidatus Neomarinimicrobiota bacterium]
MKKPLPNPEELSLENQRMLWLRVYTDRVIRQLQTMSLDEPKAVSLLEQVKQEILRRFPDKERAYRLIYERRFKRILQRRGLFLPLTMDNGEIN